MDGFGANTPASRCLLPWKFTNWRAMRTVHVVRKTALNYSERENVRQTCGHSPPNMGLKTRCMHHVRVFCLAHGDRVMAHLDICPFLLMDELFNLIDLTKPMNLVEQ